MDPSAVCRDRLVSGASDRHMSTEQMVEDVPATSHHGCGDDYIDIEEGIEISGRPNLDVICEVNSTDHSNRQVAETGQIINRDTTIESIDHRIDCPVNREDIDNQSECRVCHLSFGESSSCETIKLGCHCKDSLGLAHRNCAEAWFNIKGDRVCEICGVVAENIVGVEDSSFMEQWNDGDPAQDASTARRQRNFWQSLSLCNFILACMIVIFILLWLFRISIALH